MENFIPRREVCCQDDAGCGGQDNDGTDQQVEEQTNSCFRPRATQHLESPANYPREPSMEKTLMLSMKNEQSNKKQTKNYALNRGGAESCLKNLVKVSRFTLAWEGTYILLIPYLQKVCPQCTHKHATVRSHTKFSCSVKSLS